MNPIPLISYHSSPCPARADLHSLRYEFRHLVNSGLVSVDDFDAFVAWVDRQGGLRKALKGISGRINLSA